MTREGLTDAIRREKNKEAQTLLSSPEDFFSWLDSCDPELTFYPRSWSSCPLGVYIRERGIPDTLVSGIGIATMLYEGPYDQPEQRSVRFTPPDWCKNVMRFVDTRKWRGEPGSVLPIKRAARILKRHKKDLTQYPYREDR